MLLEVKDLNVVLGKEKVIENLSFQIKRGEILTILGPNGAGKSVLLRTLLGFIPYKGEITWHDKNKIEYLPQGLNQLKVKDLPLTVLDFFKLKNPSPSIDEIKKFLKLVGLEDSVVLKKAGDLSSGQFQRMLIAWMLVSNPEIIFLDEPTTGIDIGGGENIYSLLYNIQKQKNLTIFLVTHDLNIVYTHSSNVLCLTRKGHYCYGKPKDILNKESLEKIFGTEIKLYDHH